MRLGFFLIIGSFVLADLLAWWFTSAWLRRHSAPRWARLSAHVFFAIQTAYIVALVILITSGFAGARRSLEWIPTPVQALIYVWHIVFLPATMLFWLVVGVVLAVKRVTRQVARREPVADPVLAGGGVEEQGDDSAAGDLYDSPGLSRRSLLLASVAAIPPLLSVGATGYGLTQTWRFKTRALSLAIPGLPPALEGLRIAHVSDLHVGRWSSQAFLNNVIDATNALNADVVLFTGDLLDVSIEDLPQAIDTLKRMRARQGLYLVEGNHDLIDNGPAFRRTVVSEGLNFLYGNSAYIQHNAQSVQLLGLPWSRGEAAMAADVANLAAHRSSSAFPILLAHHPHAFDQAAIEGFPLTLAGHTHGGQLALTEEINAGQMMFRYLSGVYEQGAARLVVSNGTGNWFPLRINAPAEIIDLTLVRG